MKHTRSLRAAIRVTGGLLMGFHYYLGAACAVAQTLPLMPKKGMVSAAAICSERRLIALAPSYGVRGTTELTLHDARSGRMLRRLAMPRSRPGVVRVRMGPLAFSPNATMLVGGSREAIGGGFSGRLILWNTKTGKVQRTREWQRALVSAVAFAPDGRTLAYATAERRKAPFDAQFRGQVTLCDAATGAVLHTLRHGDYIWSIAFSPEGRLIASTDTDGPDGPDGRVRVWSRQTGQSVFTLSGHRHLVGNVAFSADGKTLATASWDRTVRLWDTGSGRLQKTLATGTVPSAMAISSDGTKVAVGGVTPRPPQAPQQRRRIPYRVQLVQVRTGSARTVHPSTSDVVLVAFTSDERSLVWVDTAGRLHRLALK